MAFRFHSRLISARLAAFTRLLRAAPFLADLACRHAAREKLTPGRRAADASAPPGAVRAQARLRVDFGALGFRPLAAQPCAPCSSSTHAYMLEAVSCCSAARRRLRRGLIDFRAGRD